VAAILRERRMGIDCLIGMGFSSGSEKTLHNFVNILNHSLYTSKWGILWYVNCISKKSLHNKVEQLQDDLPHEMATKRHFYFYRALSNNIRISTRQPHLT